jgi:hypothetical protein
LLGSLTGSEAEIESGISRTRRHYMKYLKILGLAAVAAMALMAFAGSASATMTYSPQCTGGPEVNTCPAGTVLSMSLEPGTSSILKSGTTTLNTCTGGKFSSKITNAGSSTATTSGENTTIDFENCVSTVDPVKLGTLEVHSISGTTNGTVTASGVVIGNTIFGTDCLYESGTGKDLGTLNGSTTGNATIHIEISVNEAEPKKSICPDTATWTAAFLVTGPSPYWVEAI